jgi:hypothetical protein
MTFRVLQFEEPNLEDTLTVRWFVDYYRNPAIQQQAVRPPERASPNPTLRSGSSFTLTLSMLEPNPSASPHLVEVLVSDRPFDDPGQPTQLNRTFAADALGDLLSWTVQVTSTPAKPTLQRAELKAFGDVTALPDEAPAPRLPWSMPPAPQVRWPWLQGTEAADAR